jgi:hypothetical protein
VVHPVEEVLILQVQDQETFQVHLQLKVLMEETLLAEDLVHINVKAEVEGLVKLVEMVEVILLLVKVVMVLQIQ